MKKATDGGFFYLWLCLKKNDLKKSERPMMNATLGAFSTGEKMRDA